MFYKLQKNKFIKLTLFWSIIALLLMIFTFLAKYEIKPRKREVEIKIDIKNKINICIPEEEVEIW